MSGIQRVGFLLGIAASFLSLHTARAQSSTAPTTRAANLFDPARHMHVAEVRAGMTGYGLTVFSGDKIERFDVEVLSVLKNFNPQYDVVLIRCKDARLEHTGAIQGMSGSPIYLQDKAGRARMIGAFAYGWPLSKDPVAGVQPIEYMLDLPTAPPNRPTTPKGPGGTSAESSVSSGAWSLSDVVPHFHLWDEHVAITNVQNRGPNFQQLSGDGELTSRLAPLSTPIMVAGLPANLIERLAPAFKANGMIPLQTGASSSPKSGEPPVALEPGAVLAVPLLTGDLELTAVGTCTEVIGDRVWGFGHPFNNEGRVSLPMASGRINGIIPSLQMSFKLGALDRIRGTLNTDASVGVSGMLGATPPMIPIELTVSPADGSSPRSYHFQAARHPKLTPMIAAAAFAGALSGSSELPQFNTIDYNLKLEFANGKTVTLADRSVNALPGEIFNDAQAVMSAAADNPFQRVLLQKITGSAKILPQARQAQILDVHLPKSKYRPGEVIKAYVTYQPFRAGPATLPLEMELPHDLPPGEYQLVISDSPRYFEDEQQEEAFRLSAGNINDVFALLREVTAIRNNALYLRLLRQSDGVAIGRTAMPRLPSSRRQVMLGAGRSDTTAYISSTTKIIPTELVMSGAAEFTIRIEAGAKVAVGGANPPSRSATPTKAEEPRKGSAKEPGPKDAPREIPKASDEAP